MFGEHSRTFVLEEFHSVLGTISIFPDNKLGVPLESLYSEEITCFRESGVRFAEVGLLATNTIATSIDSNYFSSKDKMLPVFLLFKIAINYSIFSGISHLVIAVHPKHRQLYEFFGFRQFAEVRSYPTVCGNPALPMIQNLKEETRLAARVLREFFFTSPFASKHFSRSFADAPDPFAEFFGYAYDAYDSVTEPGNAPNSSLGSSTTKGDDVRSS